MSEANTTTGEPSGRGALFSRWLAPVLACTVAVALHAYFHVPKGKYAPRPSPEAIKKHRAKLQRQRLKKRRASQFRAIGNEQAKPRQAHPEPRGPTR